MSQSEHPPNDSLASPSEEVDTTPPSDGPPGTFQIGGFWRRGFAAMIDMLLLGIVLNIVGLASRPYVFLLGPWGRLVGLAASLAYFGTLNSRLRAGQTLAKRWLRLAVVDADGDYLPVRKSMLRTAILSLILLMNGWDIPFVQKVPVLLAAQSIILVGGGLTLIYTLTFNRKTRQGPHDLLVGSYVIVAPPQPEAIAPHRPPVHRNVLVGILGLSVVLAIAGPIARPERIVGGLGVMEPGEWQEIEELHSILSADKRFFTVSVTRGYQRQLGRLEADSALSISVWYKGMCSPQESECLDVVRDIAEIAFDEYEGIEQLEAMHIRVESRYELGLATLTISGRMAYTISEWEEYLAEHG